MIRRVWLFADIPGVRRRSGFITREEFANWMYNSNITDVAFMTNQSLTPRFALSLGSLAWLESIAVQLGDMDVATHLVVLLRPTRDFLASTFDVLGPLCSRIRTRTGGGSVMFDAEGWWRNPLIRAARAARRPVAEHVGAFLEASWPAGGWPCPLGVTDIVSIGLPGTAAHQAIAPLAERCDYVLPQAYSVASTSAGEDLRARPIYQPGQTQRRAHEIWQAFKKPIVMGLAAWNLNLTGSGSQTAAMQRAVASIENLPKPVVEQIAYWHLKFLYRPDARTQERFRFVQQAAIKARLGVSQRRSLNLARTG
jgi:hypothetical protein